LTSRPVASRSVAILVQDPHLLLPGARPNGGGHGPANGGGPSGRADALRLEGLADRVLGR
jgi:hypothetical protein